MLVFYFRVKQTKVTDFIEIELNSIDINPRFFNLYLREWRKNHFPNAEE